MRETAEFSVREDYAAKYLPPGVGVAVGVGIRRVVVDTDEPLYGEIGRLHRKCRAAGEYFVLGREYTRQYTRRELEQARLFHVRPRKVFEPAGEECGTAYDDSIVCRVCGGGAPQVTPLFLDGRRIPKKDDIVETIAGEVVVSARVVSLFKDNALIGAVFDPIRLSNKGGTPSGEYWQLRPVGSRADVDPRTRVGSDPFEDDRTGRCIRGDVLGLNLLSEVWIRGGRLPDADFIATNQMVGVRRGLLRPRTLMLLSPKAWRVIETGKVRGLIVEVAHLT